MNKTQLIEHLKQPEDKINSLLSEAGIATDLKQYTKDQLKTLQAIHQLVESGKAKTYKAAAQLYHQQQTPTSEPIEQEAVIDPEQSLEQTAEWLAEKYLAELPEWAGALQDHIRAKLIKRVEYHIAKGLQNPEYQKRFEAKMLGQDLGKSKLSSTTTTPIALPSSTSSTS